MWFTLILIMRISVGSRKQLWPTKNELFSVVMRSHDSHNDSIGAQAFKGKVDLKSNRRV